jgi:hypothetical protein
MDSLREICVGDWIKFFESLERNGYNKQGNRVVFNSNQRQVVIAKVVGKTAKGMLKLEPCFTLPSNRNEWIKQDKSKRKPDKLFMGTSCLQLRNKEGRPLKYNEEMERGELLVCSSKSKHPDAEKHRDIASAVRRNGETRYQGFSIYCDDLARTLHDDTCQEIKRERRELSIQEQKDQR